MIRSKSQDLGEYDLIRTPEHVARVWAAIEKSLPTYWSRLVESERQHHTESLFAEKCGKELPAEAIVVGPLFTKALADYEKAAEKYRHWFDSETLAEFHDDPNAFKLTLSRDIPIIANTLRQRRDELKEWQMHFHETKAKDLLEVFSNVIDFVDEWANEHPSGGYADLDDPAAFGLDPLDDDETMVISSVIGMGIKSISLYHLDPTRFPARGQNALYGMYFLSGRSDFRLPSKTSEFLMIDDIHQKSGCIIMAHNYWYPYGVFSLYALRISKWVSAHLAQMGIATQEGFRFVYVERLFQAVCEWHHEDLKTMRGHERFEAPL